MDIRGGYAKPTIRDILWIQLFMLPWTTCKWTYFYTRWLWKFGIKREEYGEEEKLYVIRKNLGLSQGQFDVRVSDQPVRAHLDYVTQPCVRYHMVSSRSVNEPL